MITNHNTLEMITNNSNICLLYYPLDRLSMTFFKKQMFSTTVWCPILMTWVSDTQDQICMIERHEFDQHNVHLAKR